MRSPDAMRFLSSSYPVVVALLLWPSSAAAQDPDAPFRLPTPKRWGVELSITPKWFTPDGGSWSQDLYCGLLIPAGRFSNCEEVSLGGSDFRVGFLRGRSRGGDWGVAYVRRRFSDDAAVRAGLSCPAESLRPYLTGGGFSFPSGPSCGALFSGPDSGYYFQFTNVTLSGPEFHWSIPITTIANRVQLGFTAAGGIGSLKGFADGFSTTGEQSGVNLGSPFPTVRAVRVDIDGLLSKTQFMARTDFDVAVRVAPGVKVRASAGLDMQGAHIGGISLLYFFGDE